MLRKSLCLLILTGLLSGVLCSGAFSGASSGQSDDPVSSDFRLNGYDPTQLESEGSHLCQASSSETSIAENWDLNNAVSAALKRKELVYAAVGFAKQFKHEESTDSSCKNAIDGDCTGTDKLVRELSHIRANQDWCAAFVADLSKMVDEQAGSGPSNVLHSSPRGTDASDYASVAKLLAIFDPSVDPKTMDWTGKKPTRKTEDFLPANLPPVPGCEAIYKDATKEEGHVALVISVSGGYVSTVEGNSAPVRGSSEQGVYAKFNQRPWGVGSYYTGDNGDQMVYQGCVLPWPGDSVAFGTAVCPQAASDAEFKPVQSGPSNSALLRLPSLGGIPY